MNFIFSVICSKLKPLFKAFILDNLHLEKLYLNGKVSVLPKGEREFCFLCVHKSTYVKINKKEIHFFFNLFVGG